MFLWVKFSAGARGEIKIWNTSKGLDSKIHLAVDANGMPIRIFVPARSVHWLLG